MREAALAHVDTVAIAIAVRLARPRKFCDLTDMTLEYHQLGPQVGRRCVRAGVAMWSRLVALALLLLPARPWAARKERSRPSLRGVWCW